MSTVIETVQHYGMCLLCKKSCKVKYASFEDCPDFEWIECIDWMEKKKVNKSVGNDTPDYYALQDTR